MRSGVCAISQARALMPARPEQNPPLSLAEYRKHREMRFAERRERVTKVAACSQEPATRKALESIQSASQTQATQSNQARHLIRSPCCYANFAIYVIIFVFSFYLRT